MADTVIGLKPNWRISGTINNGWCLEVYKQRRVDTTSVAWAWTRMGFGDTLLDVLRYYVNAQLTNCGATCPRELMECLKKELAVIQPMLCVARSIGSLSTASAVASPSPFGDGTSTISTAPGASASS